MSSRGERERERERMALRLTHSSRKETRPPLHPKKKRSHWRRNQYIDFKIKFMGLIINY